MGIDLSSTQLASRFRATEVRRPRQWRADAIAIGVLSALPLLVFGLPALLGHAVIPGDDLTQNFPLREFAGQLIRDGHLPLYDPYIWSGAPLLAGWNAGAAYPLTLLFAIGDPNAAWTLNLIVTWAVAGTGTFLFLRALRLGSLASFLGALSFAFAGAMSAQVSHFGLVAGMSWVPLGLLAVLRLTEDRAVRSRLRWAGVLAAATGMVILAGEPRAVDDAVVILVSYAAWRLIRLGRRCGPALAFVAAGAALGVCLGAVQWLPGLAAVASSQRAGSSMALFNSGSLTPKWLLLTLVPDLLGGSGSLGQPNFFANYNLSEVTSYVGILPLVAAAVLLARFRLRPLPDWAVWHVVAVVGVLLALGGHTPLGHLLIHVPLFGDQRLQSRNIMVTDFALAVLLAYWADDPLTERGRRLLRGRRIRLETALGMLPALGMIAVVGIGLCWGAGLLHWLGIGASTASVAGRLRPWLIPYAVIGAGAIGFLLFGRRLRPGARARLLCGFVVADLIVFSVLVVVAVGTGLGGGGAASDRAVAGPVPGQAGTQVSAPRPIASLGFQGRFAIYDPNLIDARQLTTIGAPDANSISGTASVQGYTAIVDRRYAAVTGSHAVSGGGQDALSPQAVRSGILSQLDTSVLLTLPAYLITSPGASAAAGPPGTGVRDVAAHARTTWYLGTPLAVTRLTVPDAGARQAAASGLRIGLTEPDGSTVSLPARAAGGSELTVSLPAPVRAVAVVGQTSSAGARLGPPSVTGPDGIVFMADGQLQDALTAAQWQLAGNDGSFAVFTEDSATSMLSLRPVTGQTASGASVRQLSGPVADPTAAEVRSPHGVRVIRSVAAIPGWTAVWHPAKGKSVQLTVSRAGLIQSVDVPAGQGVVTWSYVSPGFRPGVALSLGAAAVLLLLMLNVAVARRWPSPVRIPATGPGRGRAA